MKFSKKIFKNLSLIGLMSGASIVTVACGQKANALLPVKLESNLRESFDSSSIVKQVYFLDATTSGKTPKSFFSVASEDLVNLNEDGPWFPALLASVLNRSISEAINQVKKIVVATSASSSDFKDNPRYKDHYDFFKLLSNDNSVGSKGKMYGIYNVVISDSPNFVDKKWSESQSYLFVKPTFIFASYSSSSNSQSASYQSFPYSNPQDKFSLVPKLNFYKRVIFGGNQTTTGDFSSQSDLENLKKNSSLIWEWSDKKDFFMASSHTNEGEQQSYKEIIDRVSQKRDKNNQIIKLSIEEFSKYFDLIRN